MPQGSGRVQGVMWLWICLAIIVVGGIVNTLLARRAWRKAKRVAAAANGLLALVNEAVTELEAISATSTRIDSVSPRTVNHGAKT